ncbi:uncharacterized protein LOC113359256 [Papaver somniferum]|uniref:uncharacterized protein LOC113359256 n=1 Tax=Papaver somniferum TaxID=3469 RepID=UPI000E7004B7|nr:uncharacterized protein LOC113359256 [Papaver somniferum]
MCVFCNSVVESTYHLFFDCDYAKEVWSLQPMASQGVTQTLNSHNTFLHKYNEWIACDINSISKAPVATKCWFIWKERFLKIFEDKSITPEQLALDITRHYDYWHLTRLHTLAQSQVRHIKPIPYWKFPEVNTVKINCDASCISENTNAGFGFVIRNRTGTLKAAESVIFRTSTAEEAEALTLLQATNWAITNNLQHLVIEGDNQAIIKHLQGKDSTIPWQSLAILEEVRKQTANLTHFLGFNFVDRKANKVADLLAKNGKKNIRHQPWL